MKLFLGYRPLPPQEYVERGLTNAGKKPDYVGVVMPSGQVILEWQTGVNSVTIYPDYDSFYKITGHPEYGTQLKFIEVPYFIGFG